MSNPNMIVIYNNGTRHAPRREMVHFKPKELLYIEDKDDSGYALLGFDLKSKKDRNLYLTNIDAMADANKFNEALARIGLTIHDGEWDITDIDLFKRGFLAAQIESLMLPGGTLRI